MNLKFLRIFFLFLIILFINVKVWAEPADDLRMLVNQDKMNLDILYVIEENFLEEMRNQNALILNIENNSLIVSANNISLEDIEIIRSAKIYHVFGSINTDNIPSENMGEHLFNNDTTEYNFNQDFFSDKNIIVTNKESKVDVMNTLQISNIEERNILLLENNKITNQIYGFLSFFGEDKNILFIEGETQIPEETKQEILQLANAPKYELDTFIITKKIENKKVDLTTFLPETVDNIKVNEEETNIFNNMQSVSVDTINKQFQKNEEIIKNKGKILKIEDISDIETYINDKIKSYKFIRKLQDQGELLNVQIKNKEYIGILETQENLVNLKITYANPVNIHKYISTEKDIFVTKKDITEEVIQNVISGEYGETGELKENLEKEGYSYEEVDRELKKRNVNKISRGRNIRNNNIQVLFVSEALKMEGWTYSQNKRWQTGYADCSSLVLRALINTGLIDDHRDLTTETIKHDPRFYEIPIKNIQYGDILWHNGHMKIYLGNNTTFGAFREGVPAGYASNISRFNKAYRLLNP